VPSPAPFHTFETPPLLNAAGTKIIGAAPAGGAGH
jgi:cytochrome c oxidase subunit 1